MATRIPIRVSRMRKEKNSVQPRASSARAMHALRAETHRPEPRQALRHIDLFSGIGGFALAAESVWGNVEHVFCDNEPFAQAILKKHWPQAEIYGDIRQFTGGGSADIVTGGFPCQPFSSAGKRRGTQDDRHLWPEMLRVIRETSPTWVIAENVSGLLTWDGGMVLERVLADLEEEGYEAWPLVIPACSQNAPHKRDRVWIIAHTDCSADRGNSGANVRTVESKGISQRYEVGELGESDTVRISSNSGLEPARREGKGLSGERKHCQKEGKRSAEGNRFANKSEWNNWPEASARLCTLDDGISGGLVRPKRWRNAALKAAGNAIVPQVAVSIMKAIKATNTI